VKMNESWKSRNDGSQDSAFHDISHAGEGHARRRSAVANRPETPRAEESLQWVTARLPPDLVREIEAHAKRAGTTRSDAIPESLAIGMETIRGRDGVPGGRVDELLGASRAFASRSTPWARRPSERSGSWPSGQRATGT
jgi:hypothetical protein